MKLNAISNTYIQWEPDNKVAGGAVLRAFNKGNRIGMGNSWKVKLKRIKERIAEGIDLYFDSDFRFAMVWADYAIRDIKNFKVVNVHRNPALIARSLTWHGYYTHPDKGGLGGGWLFQPDESENLTALKNHEDANPAMKAVWHTFEVIERKKKFLRENPQIPVFDFDLERDRNEETFIKLFDFLEVEINESVLKIVRSDPIINSWMGKRLIAYDITLEEIQEMVNNYEVRYR